MFQVEGTASSENILQIDGDEVLGELVSLAGEHRRPALEASHSLLVRR